MLIKEPFEVVEMTMTNTLDLEALCPERKLMRREE